KKEVSMFKVLIFSVFMSISTSSFACSYDEEPFEDMNRDPSLEKTIMVVKVWGDNFNKSIRAEKPWNSMEIKLGAMCPFIAMIGRKYIFLSYLTTEEIKT